MNPYSDLPDWLQVMHAESSLTIVVSLEVGPSWWTEMRARYGGLPPVEQMAELASALAPIVGFPAQGDFTLTIEDRPLQTMREAMTQEDS